MTAQALTNTLTPEAQSLLNHLHLGGDWAYYWRLSDKKSIWYPAGEYPALPGDKDIYFGVHPTRQPGAEDERSTKEYKPEDHKNNREVSVINALFAELDAKDYLPPEIRAKYPEKVESKDISPDHINAGKDRAIERVITTQPQPSVIIDSGGGFHCYWLLTQAWHLNTPEDRTAAAELQARWIEYTGADKGSQDLARVLRIPGTLNGKYNPARTVICLTAQFDMLYTLEELQEACKDIKAPEKHVRIAPILPNGEGRPGDDYNQKADWKSILDPHGWKALSDKGQINYWQRPGKNTGVSATTGYAGADLLYVFTSSAAPLEAHRSYNKFAAYATLNHAGDFKAAAKELVRLGFGNNGHHPQKSSTHATQTQNETLQPTQPTPGYYRLDDIGNGERLARRHGWRLRHVKEWGWMVYNGKAWESDRGQAAQLAKETARSIYAEAAACEDDNKSAALAAHAKATASENKRGAMLSAAASEPGIIADPKDFDRNPWLLNCDNGVLDLRTGNLANHNPDLLLTKKAGAAYDPGAQCPTWLSFLDRIFAGDSAIINFIQLAAGYTLTGSIEEHCLFFLYGSGANGKSTFIEALQAVLGDYARKTPTQTLMHKNRDESGPNPDVARLAGARMVSANEVANGHSLNEALVKDLTGGDRISARYLNKEYFEFTPSFKLWMYGNHKPSIEDTDDGIKRRLKLIPFEVSIPEHERDKKLSEKLKMELAGILTWCVEGCLKWQQNGLEVPQKVLDATKKYFEEQDILGAFISDCCVINPLDKTQASDLFAAYEKWAAEYGVDKKLNSTMFGKNFSKRGFAKERANSGNIYRGIGLLEKTS